MLIISLSVVHRLVTGCFSEFALLNSCTVMSFLWVSQSTSSPNHPVSVNLHHTLSYSLIPTDLRVYSVYIHDQGIEFGGGHMLWLEDRVFNATAGVKSQTVLKSALEKADWPASRSGRFTVGEIASDNHWIGDGRSGHRGEKVLAPAGKLSRIPRLFCLWPIYCAEKKMEPR
jgi:hypothetical protein